MTPGEQSKAIEQDRLWQSRRRIRVVLEYLDNGHAIQREQFEFHEVKPGQDKDDVALVALEHSVDALEKRTRPREKV